MCRLVLVKLSLFLWFTVFLDFVQAFTFEVVGQPKQCDPLSFSWTGGQPPFRLIAVIPDGDNLNFSIPDSNFNDNKGTFKINTLEVYNQTQLFFAMSDATGPISGGTSGLMTVGNPANGKKCNATAVTNDFVFTVAGTLSQCQNFPFTAYGGAQLPLTIFAFIPNSSDSFVIPFSPPQAKSFTWKANITAQTQVAISVIDSQNRRGGTDQLRSVAGSSNKACLLNNGSTGGSSPTGGSGNPDSQSKTSLSTGAIAGIAVGAVLVAILLAGLLWRLMKKRSKAGDHVPHKIDLDAEHPNTEQPMLSIDPFPPGLMPSGPGAANASASSLQPDHEGSSSSRSGATEGSPGSRTTKPRSNFIVHRDIEEADEPIDLPPQYVDRRAPIPGLADDTPSQPVETRPGKT